MGVHAVLVKSLEGYLGTQVLDIDMLGVELSRGLFLAIHVIAEITSSDHDGVETEIDILLFLYLEDQDGKVMFEANHVAAGFEIMPLLEGKFVFTTVRLFGFSFNLRKHTPESPSSTRRLNHSISTLPIFTGTPRWPDNWVVATSETLF